MENKKPKILCCDDEPLLCDILSEILEDEGFSVICAFSGREGVEKFRASNFQCVLSDFRMPNGDGLELLQEIRKISPNVPVIIFNTANEKVTTEDLLKEGASRVFSKPFDIPTILDELKKQLT